VIVHFRNADGATFTITPLPQTDNDALTTYFLPVLQRSRELTQERAEKHVALQRNVQPPDCVRFQNGWRCGPRPANSWAPLATSGVRSLRTCARHRRRRKPEKSARPCAGREVPGSEGAKRAFFMQSRIRHQVPGPMDQDLWIRTWDSGSNPTESSDADRAPPSIPTGAGRQGHS
jgi:hypothetical protein